MSITKLKVVLRNFANAPKRIFAILSQILKSAPFKNLVFEEKIIILLCDDVPTKLNGVTIHKTGIFVAAALELQSSPVLEQFYSTLACEMFGYFTLCVV